MSDQLVRVLCFGALLLHGLGHGGALGALAWFRFRPGTSTGAWTTARSWLLPSLAPAIATRVASVFWIVALAGFVATALAFWFGAGDAWQALAIPSAVVSTIGIVLFFGNWPLFNTLAALAFDVALLLALLVVGWTPPAA